MKNANVKNDKKNFEMTGTARKAVCAAFLAGGLFAGQAKASVPAASASIPNRVAAVRAELSKRVADADSIGKEAVSKLPYAQMEVASWLNWVNWSNWNNWRNWNNWQNWQNWSNWINF